MKIKKKYIIYLLSYDDNIKNLICNYIIEKYNYNREYFLDLITEEFCNNELIDKSFLNLKTHKKENSLHKKLKDYIIEKKSNNKFYIIELFFKKYKINEEYIIKDNLIISDFRNIEELEFIILRKKENSKNLIGEEEERKRLNKHIIINLDEERINDVNINATKSLLFRTNQADYTINTKNIEIQEIYKQIDEIFLDLT